jgi:hypothetical protein
LINGDFAIDQRNEGAAKSYGAGGNVAYGIDCWYASGFCAHRSDRFDADACAHRKMPVRA